MKKYIKYITIFMFVAPLLILGYKTFVLDLSLLPHKIDDMWQIHVTIKPKANTQSVSFPVPRTGPGLKVTDEKFKTKGLVNIIDSKSESTILTWYSKESIADSINYSAKVDIKQLKFKHLPKDQTENYPVPIKKYLKVPEITKEEEEAIKLLESAILEGHEDKTTLARKLFYYLDEEVQRNVKFKTILEAINDGKGSPLLKAKLYTILTRRQNIPSRIVVMVRLPETKNIPDEKFRFTFANEIFLNNHWIPVDTNRGFFAERPDNYLVFHHNYEEIDKMISKKKVVYNIVLERSLVNKFNHSEYRKEIMKKDSFVSFFSLYRLPLPTQRMFITLLLIPLGALVLCIARNLIGIPTFGMFTPILLTVFFKETSFGFGAVFFLFVVGLGIIERYVLDKFYLLALPRLSIIVTLVVMLLLTYSFVSVDTPFFSQPHLGFFPIVIVTAFIEKFSIMLTEEGTLNTFKTLAGTFIISILAYSVYSIHWLEIFIFTNPEILMVMIGFMILVGQYKGYRLSELLRFSDLVKQVQKKKNKL